MAVAAFRPGDLPRVAATMSFTVAFTALVLALPVEFMRYGVVLSTAGIANGPVLLPWETLVRIEVTGGWWFRRVWFVREGRQVVLRGPWALRTVFKSGYAEFDAGVAELRRWAEAYAPQANVVVRRRGPDWLGDLFGVLLNCVVVLVPVVSLDVLY